MLRNAALVVLVALFTVPALAQGWVDRTGPNGPPPRHSHAMCYDPVRGCVLMVGGSGGTPSAPAVLAETWRWNGTVWDNPSGAPIGPFNGSYGANQGAMCAMAFHSATNTMLLVVKPSLTNNGTLAAYEWNGTSWTNQTATGLAYHPYQPIAMAYDQVRQETVVYSQGNPLQVAVWNGANWVLRSVVVAPTISNTYGNTAASWDSTVGRIVLSGMDSFQPTARFYEWTGFGWNQRLPTTLPARTGATTSDSIRQRIIMVDADWAYSPGSTQPNHTWMLANGTCTRLTTFVEPTLREGTAMAFDPVRGVCVLFGGFNGNPMGDTWEFDLGPLASYTTFGTGCVGSNGMPSIAAQGTSTPRVGTTFTLQVNALPWTGPAFLFLGLSDTSYLGTPLPFNLGVLGAPGCNLLTDAVSVHLLTNVLGSAQWSFVVPPVPGGTFFNQVFPLDLAANPLGLTASNGGRGVIGL